jgi:ribosome-associated translation inhibitor RaiA
MSFSLKLDVCAADVPCAYSITELVVEKIKSLQERFKNICGVEIHLYENGEMPNASKGATVSINTREKIVVETCNSRNWEDAVSSVYEKIEQRFLSAYYAL